MKKYLIFSVIYMISILLTSCNEWLPWAPSPDDPVIPPVDFKPTATLSIVPSDGIIPYGTSVMVSWNSNTNYNTINGIQVNPKDSVTVKLYNDTTFEFKAIYSNQSDIEVKYLKVGDWTTSLFGLFTHGSFKQDFIDRGYADGSWKRSKLWGVPGENQNRKTFLTDGTYDTYLNGAHVGNGSHWSTNETSTIKTLRLENQTWEIEEISDSSLIIVLHDVPCVGGTNCDIVTIKEIYSRF